MSKHNLPPWFFRRLDYLQEASSTKRHLIFHPLKYEHAKEVSDATASETTFVQGPAKKTKVVAVDFDGTCVTNAYPKLGDDIGAVPWLQAASQHCRLLLFTMRDKEPLDDAIAWFRNNQITLWAVNNNPEQNWSQSRKVYANLYIDDAALGVPLHYPSNGKPYVDWRIIGPLLMKYLNQA